MKSLLLSFGLIFAGQIFAAPVTYKVDPAHTSIVFGINHMDYSNVYGMFTGAEGQIVWDDADPTKSTIEVSVKAANVNTGDKKRDDHLRNPDFFNAKQFPKITVKSKSIKKAGDKKYEVVADLTLHGVTKPITFTFQHNKTAKDPFGKDRTGGEALFTVKRSDFAMTHMQGAGAIGDEVKMIVNVEAIK